MPIELIVLILLFPTVAIVGRWLANRANYVRPEDSDETKDGEEK
jgi:hypothetical protein